jgi:hypothetical protein
MASITDQYFSVDVDNILAYSTSGAEKALNGPMRNFLLYNPSSTRFMFVSWSGNDDHVVIPPSKIVIVRERSQVERLFVRAGGAAGGAALLLHVSCSSHNAFGAM